ncbi:MAG: FAD-binding oxidoreductase [Actinomycetota bacterium]
MWKSKRRVALDRQRGHRPDGLDIPPQALDELRTNFQGRLVGPSDPTYDHARQMSNHAFSEWPLLIAYCEVPSDVAACLTLAREHDIWTVVRSGGHSTAGYSVNTGLVIDMSSFCYAVVDEENHRAVVGAGTNFGHLNAVLNDYDLHVPGGGCEDVCVAGYMQGGGFGFTSRPFGMNCDNVEAVRVMLADGSIVVANESTNSDLYWAIRGGTGNNFGVLLEITYRLHQLPSVWAFGLRWPIERAADGLDVMQRKYMRGGVRDELGYMSFLANVDGTNELLMRGMVTSGEDMSLLAALERSGGTVDINQTGSYFEMNRMLLETPEVPQVPDLGREDKQSAYMADPLGVGGWQQIVDQFVASPNTYSTVVIEPYGGAVASVERTANAFVHREVDCDVFVDVFWMTDEQHAQVVPYLDDYLDVLHGLSNGHSYQNYPRRGTVDYRWRYWGGCFDTLLAVKRKYDPSNFFQFAQSISAPDGPEPRLGSWGPDLSGSLSEPIVTAAP